MPHLGACRNADAQVPPSQSLIQQVEGEVQGLQALETVTQVVISPHFGIHQASELSGVEQWDWAQVRLLMASLGLFPNAGCPVSEQVHRLLELSTREDPHTHASPPALALTP